MIKLGSLRARLLVPTLTLSVLAMVGAVAVGATLMVRHLSVAFEEQAARKVDFVATVGVPYVTNYDLTALGLFVKELSRDQQVAFAEFFDADGKSLTADVATSPKDTSGLLLVQRDMKDSAGKTVGRLSAGFRNDSVTVARNLVLGAIGGGMLVVLVVVAGLLLWSVRYVMNVIGSEPANAVQVADGIASGDLTRSVAVNSGDMSSLTSALARMQQQLQKIVGDIRQASSSIQVSSAEIAQGHAELSARTEEQASSLEQAAASMEQMTATVSQNADNARKATQLAASASDVATKGGQAVGAVVTTMGGISESSRKIADIIAVIDGIAFQTNILALNAAVEAARAGEQGRGFAVVASEVRILAQRSSDAAKEIRQLISDSVGRIEAGTKQVAAAGETMGEIVSSVKRVTDLIGEISVASLEQSQGLTQVSQTVTQLERVTQQNASMVQQATSASDSLQEQAMALMRAVGGFKLAEEAASAEAVRHASAPSARTAGHATVASSSGLPKYRLGAAAAQLNAPKARAAHGSQAKVDGTWEEF